MMSHRSKEDSIPLLSRDSPENLETEHATVTLNHTTKVTFSKHGANNPNNREPAATDYNNLTCETICHIAKHSNSSWRTYSVIAVFTVVCTALIVILLLTYELQINCPESMIGKTASKRSLESSVKFLLASDIHYDFYYDNTVSSSTFCRKLGNLTQADYQASYGRVGCDSPEKLVESCFREMEKIISKEKVEFILLTGDFSAHKTDAPYFINSSTRERVLTNIRITTEKLHSIFPTIPVFPILGNNDFAAHNTVPDNEEDTWYKDTFELLAPLILCHKCPAGLAKPTNDSALRGTFLEGGYYKVHIAGGRLVLLVLNSMYWFSQANVYATFVKKKAMVQLKWLEEELENAKRQGKRVLLASHVPPGVDSYDEGILWLDSYTRLYTELVVGRFSDIIAGQLYGHLHKDDFKLLTQEPHAVLEGTSVDTPSLVPNTDGPSPVNKSFIILIPSISVIYANNPSFRLVYLDPVKQVILDYDQYYMDIVMATEFHSADWQFDYRFSTRYPSHRPLIDAQRIYQLSQNILNRTNKQPWVNYAFSRAVNYQIAGYSRFRLYCSMRHIYESNYRDCVKHYYVLGG